MPQFGDSTSGTSFTGALAGDQSWLSRAVLPQPGFVQSLTLDLQSIGVSEIQALTPVIYADLLGVPGSLLGQTPTIVVAPGTTPSFVTVAFPSALNLPAGTYWLGALMGPTGGQVEIARTVGAGKVDYASNSFASGPASVYPGVVSSSTDSYSIYGTYIVGPLSAGRRKKNYSGAYR